MKNTTTSQLVNPGVILNAFGRLFKFLFASNDNREFERLKNFIAS